MHIFSQRNDDTKYDMSNSTIGSPYKCARFRRIVYRYLDT